MLASSIPTKIAVPFGNSAGGSYIRTVPVASQIGINAGYASYTDGFVPLNMTPVGAGGVPPFGQDMNGVLNAITKWNQWQNAGGSIPYDATFQTTVGGYPAGAIVASAVNQTLFWYSTADNNVTNPDTGGAGWVGYTVTGTPYAVDTGTVNALVVTFLSGTADIIGRSLLVKVANTNTTTSPTINLGGGARTISDPSGASPSIGALVAGQIVSLIWTGSVYQIQNPVSLSKLGVRMVPVNPVDVTLTQNSPSYISVFNDSTGAAASAGFQALGHTGGYARFLNLGSGYSTAGILNANATAIIGTNDIVFLAGNGGAGSFRWAVNGSALEAMRLGPGPAGGIGLGLNLTTSPRGIVDLIGDTNANANYYFQNINAGAAANTVLRIFNSSGNGLQAYHTSTSFTTSGLTIADQTSLLTTGLGGMLVGTATNSGLSFVTNGVNAGNFDTSQNLNLLHALSIGSGGTSANTTLGARQNFSVNAVWSSVTGLGAGSQVITFTHNLGVNPALIEVFVVLICNSADAGYGVGDVIRWGSTMPDNGNRLTTVNTNPGGNSTFVVIGLGINVANFSTQANTALTLTKWNIQIGACARNS